MTGIASAKFSKRSIFQQFDYVVPRNPEIHFLENPHWLGTGTPEIWQKEHMERWRPLGL